MKRITLINILFYQLLLAFIHPIFGVASTENLDTHNFKIKVGLYQSDLNHFEGRYNCKGGFAGVFEPGTADHDYLKLKIEADNLDKHPMGSRIKFNVMYTNNGYRDKNLQKSVAYTTRQKILSIPIYHVDDQLPFSVNQVYVTASIGSQTISDSFIYRVYRPIFISKDNDDSQGCYKMLKAQRISGILSNFSSQTRTMTIEDSSIHSFDKNHQMSSGWIVGANYSNLINLQGVYNWFQVSGRSLVESYTYELNTVIEPGESLVLARQLTLMKDPYLISEVNECGEVVKTERAFFEHWLVTYPVIKVDLQNLQSLANIQVGYNDELDTCNDQLGSYSNPKTLFLPIRPINSQQSLLKKVTLSDLNKFNEFGRKLTDEKTPLKLRKSRFRTWLKNLLD